MLDRLLGRATLKTRIEELEAKLQECRDERSSLEEQYEAAKRRETEAKREYQDVQEELNRAEDRITQLEDRIDQLTTDRETAEMEFRGVASLRGEGLAALLDRLASVDAPPDGALTAVIEDEIPERAREAFGERASLLDRAKPCIALTDADGLVSVALRSSIRPEPTVTWSDSFELDRSWFLPIGEFALALVRANLFALGEYRGDERLAIRTFESDVGRDHSKGGFSQGRFERRRDEQIDEHLEQCADALRDRSTDRLLLAGDADAIDTLDVDAEARIPVDASGPPETALEDAFRDVWRTRLYRL